MTAKIDQSLMDDLVDRYRAGDISVKNLSDRSGVSRPAIVRGLKEAGIIPRTRSEGQWLKVSKMTAGERATQAAAAHEAARGRKHSLEEKTQRAKTVMEKCLRTSAHERELAALLSARGIVTTHQYAIGPYNCDLGADPVAVEVFGGNWHWSAKKLAIMPDRFRYIMNFGWHVLAVQITQRCPLTPQAADYVAAYIEAARRNPAAIREYRVIRGAGEFVAGGRADDDEISIVPAFTNRRDPATGRYSTVARDTIRM